MPIDVTMSLTLPAGVMAADFDLAGGGMSDSFTVAAGMTETRGGVVFTCDSVYPCTVMLTNSAGTLVAQYMTQKDMEADTAMVMAAAVPVPPPEPMPMDVSGTVALTAEQQAGLLGVLPASGDSVELMVGADGVTRAGVTFTCESNYPCTITVTNSAGTIVAMYASQTLGDGTASAMATGLEPLVDAFPTLNAGSTESIRDLVGAQAGNTTPTLTDTELVGMGIGGPGVLNADDAGLRGSLDPNTEDAGGTATAPGAVPGLTGGSMLTGADHGFDASMSDIAPAPDGWVMKTLFRDWGDAAGDAGDGGFETGAIVVENLGEGMSHPFDRKLSERYVNTAAQDMFALSIRADGTAPGVTTLGTSVSINADGTAAASVQWANMVFDSDSLVPAQSQDLLIDVGETFTGEYFGAPGQFQCIAGGPTGESCALARNDDGTVGVNNTGTATAVASTGRWSFTPDDGAMITVPDQDWMAYGAWLTTPDDTGGTHRLGVFFNGMDTWTPATDSLDATNAAGLRGSATYSGGAAGVYVDGPASGLFTARAMLTAVFDADMDGVDDADEYMISGRIDDFRGTNGVALGADTGDMPNPEGRGENDWVVELGAFDFGATTDGVIGVTRTTGSADGVPWTGGWNGQLFGPTMADGDPATPSGVAGQFWAEAGEAATPADGDGMPVTAVVGAFGATKDD
ncbi:MAG: hypothetical protein J4F47_11545 [Alphaproteobacteria bacterium]|nr:hypothetical protein [Alphaproteobacteria bacterium]